MIDHKSLISFVFALIYSAGLQSRLKKEEQKDEQAKKQAKSKQKRKKSSERGWNLGCMRSLQSAQTARPKQIR